MRNPARWIVALAAALLAPSAVPASRPRGVPVAVPAGPATPCIPLAGIRESRVRDDRTIDFFMTSRRVYRTTLPQGCPGLGFEQRFGYTTSLTSLCSSDIITVIEEPPAMRGASCGLGPFQPITLPR